MTCKNSRRTKRKTLCFSPEHATKTAENCRQSNNSTKFGFGVTSLQSPNVTTRSKALLVTPPIHKTPESMRKRKKCTENNVEQLSHINSLSTDILSVLDTPKGTRSHLRSGQRKHCDNFIQYSKQMPLENYKSPILTRSLKNTQNSFINLAEKTNSILETTPINYCLTMSVTTVSRSTESKKSTSCFVTRKNPQRNCCKQISCVNSKLLSVKKISNSDSKTSKQSKSSIIETSHHENLASPQKNLRSKSPSTSNTFCELNKSNYYLRSQSGNTNKSLNPGKSCAKKSLVIGELFSELPLRTSLRIKERDDKSLISDSIPKKLIIEKEGTLRNITDKKSAQNDSSIASTVEINKIKCNGYEDNISKLKKKDSKQNIDVLFKNNAIAFIETSDRKNNSCKDSNSNSKPKTKQAVQLISSSRSEQFFAENQSSNKFNEGIPLVKETKAHSSVKKKSNSLTSGSQNGIPKKGSLKRKRWAMNVLNQKNEGYEDDIFESQDFQSVLEDFDDDQSDDDSSVIDIATPKFGFVLSPCLSKHSPLYKDCISPSELMEARKMAEKYIYRRNKKMKSNSRHESNSKTPSSMSKREEKTLPEKRKLNYSETLADVINAQKDIEKLAQHESEDDDAYFSDVSE